MDRFQIIKDIDPFIDMPHGDGCLYQIMGDKYKGWRVDCTTLILDMSENSLGYLLALKDKKLQVTCNKKIEIFEILRIITKTGYIDKRTKSKRVKVQFEGQILIPF